ncbi:helix-turn-helix transcriptional regulator [Streptacidiphilus sp. P02-A3a]|uniref:helix-turn-helix transcriptional regulator n=1 Tax=Streptacidiphilus sp. P02-A3a TaxID=2704468 RepID=UPI0015FB49AF|nr:helix-turn-helix transcriptional regulator [Streptacidiphilus sp. P02-A3a]QMU72446.1 helix-turn-helix domain-containing protein [Streptacidiphilus sp. P02-A3a]
MTSGQGRQQSELAQFLRAARARVQPADVGLPSVGSRRTPGLRRQEVAQLAAVSIDWYIRLEQGRVGTPGTGVLDSVAAALRMSPTEREHLHLVARGQRPPATHVPAPVGRSLLALLDGMPLLPAYVVDFRFGILARNGAAAALFGEEFGSPGADNAARMIFTDPAVRAAQLDWVRIARETVGNLRANLARHRDDPQLNALIGELRSASAEFAAWWGDHTVQERVHGVKRIQHAAVGELTVCYDVMAALDGSDQRLAVLTPADGAAEQALRSLIAARARSLTRPGLSAIVA